MGFFEGTSGVDANTVGAWMDEDDALEALEAKQRQLTSALQQTRVLQQRLADMTEAWERDVARWMNSHHAARVWRTTAKELAAWADVPEDVFSAIKDDARAEADDYLNHRYDEWEAQGLQVPWPEAVKRRR